jgi:transcriptional regulator with XRE-family HTH domain
VNPNNVKHAREALGARLRELRQQAGLTGKEFAESLGWQATKISKIELGRQTPTAADITVWTSATNADGALADLLASLRNLELQYAEWRRVLRAGAAARQQAGIDLDAKTTTFRIFVSTLIPGLLQTAEYARCRLVESVGLHEAPDDVDEGVRTRMRRQDILYEPSRRFHFVLTEAALRYRTCPPDVLAGQLDRLLALISLRNLRVGVIPFGTRLPVAPLHGYWFYDDTLVRAETFAAELTLVQPQELLLYSKIFHRLAGAAAYGASARSLVTRALDRLDEQGGSSYSR